MGRWANELDVWWRQPTAAVTITMTSAKVSAKRHNLREKMRQKFIQQTHDALTTVTSFSSYINSPSRNARMMLLVMRIKAAPN